MVRGFVFFWTILFLFQSVEGRVDYVLESFDDQRFGRDFFFGDWGELIDEAVDLSFSTHETAQGIGASLKLDYDFGKNPFTGVWFSLWGPTWDEEYSLDMRKFCGLTSPWITLWE